MTEPAAPRRSHPPRPPRQHGPVAWLRLVAVAIQFLTRLPVRVRYVEGDLRRAAGCFPAVGAIVAAIGIGVRWALGGLVGEGPATVLAIAAMVVTTGAFHEDGLADAADGLWGGSTPEDRLRIMRDSRLGTYGTIALILLFATKLAVLWPMALGTFAAALVPAMVGGRASSGVLLRRSQPPPDSLATLAGAPTAVGWIVAGLTCALSLVGFGRWAAVPLALSLAITVGAEALARRKVGGLTGDVLGATNQLVELGVLLSGAAALR